jgi:aminopeptidase N
VDGRPVPAADRTLSAALPGDKPGTIRHRALPEIKRDREIYFLIGWLSAFVEGQQSPSAQAEVHQYLRTTVLDKDLRLKILQSVDELVRLPYGTGLDRTVMIRRRLPD